MHVTRATQRPPDRALHETLGVSLKKPTILLRLAGQNSAFLIMEDADEGDQGFGLHPIGVQCRKGATHFRVGDRLLQFLDAGSSGLKAGLHQ